MTNKAEESVWSRQHGSRNQKKLPGLDVETRLFSTFRMFEQGQCALSLLEIATKRLPEHQDTGATDWWWKAVKTFRPFLQQPYAITECKLDTSFVTLSLTKMKYKNLLERCTVHAGDVDGDLHEMWIVMLDKLERYMFHILSPSTNKLLEYLILDRRMNLKRIAPF